ncbi:sugar ABC transporter permease [Spirochaetia bacterium]|nr:sugar ABC transporter permease [Spirochaetia bacterium]
MSTQMSPELKARLHKSLMMNIKARWQIYLLLVVPLVYLIIFAYGPMGGLIIAFKKYNFALGMLKSPWVGFTNFRRFFESYKFTQVLTNTLTLSLYSLVVTFPFPIIFALILNALPVKGYQKVIQTVTYIPYFISTVVMVGLIFQVLNYRNGLYGALFMQFAHIMPPDILAVGTNFKHIYVWSAVWQGTGYASIIYFAALANVDPTLHEAALVDGATRFQRVLYVDIPSILPTASIMLILAVGGLMNVAFEKTLLMQNSLNINFSEVISTYVYKVGLASGINDFSFSAAIGMFNSVINFILLVIANWGSKKLNGSGIF